MQASVSSDFFVFNASYNLNVPVLNMGILLMGTKMVKFT